MSASSSSSTVSAGRPTHFAFTSGLVLATVGWLTLFYVAGGSLDASSSGQGNPALKQVATHPELTKVGAIYRTCSPAAIPPTCSPAPSQRSCPVPPSPSVCPPPVVPPSASACPVCPPPPSPPPAAPSCPAPPPVVPVVCPSPPPAAPVVVVQASPPAPPPKNVAIARRNMLREVTSQCDRQYPYSESIVNGPVGGEDPGPENSALPLCNPQQLAAALRRARRPVLDGPFYVDGCRLKWYTSMEACDLIERANFLFISGDSLTRNVAQAMVGVLSGDYRTGSALHLPADLREGCVCELQFHDRIHWCRENSVVYWQNSTRLDEPWKPTFQGLICPSWTTDHFAYHDGYGSIPGDKFEGQMRRAGGGFAFTGAGMHHPFGAQPAYAVGYVYRFLLEPLNKMLNDGVRVRMIPNLMMKPGSNKFPGFDHQNDTNVRSFNAFQRKWFAEKGWIGFESYLASHNTPMADGTHVFARANYVQAQLLLNHIDAMLRQEAMEPSPSSTPNPSLAPPDPASTRTSFTTPSTTPTPAYAGPDVHGWTNWFVRFAAPNNDKPRWFHQWRADVTTYRLFEPKELPDPPVPAEDPFPIAWPPT